VRAKAATHNVLLPDEVLEYLATTIEGNVRELEVRLIRSLYNLKCAASRSLLMMQKHFYAPQHAIKKRYPCKRWLKP